MYSLFEFDKPQMKTQIPDFKAGDTLKVFCKVKEGEKERVQLFEGVVIARHNRGMGSSFTVRKMSYGIGVERIFPLHAPFIDRVEIATRGKVRRAKLYYLRDLSGKKARIHSLDTRGKEIGATMTPETAEPAVQNSVEAHQA